MGKICLAARDGDINTLRHFLQHDIASVPYGKLHLLTLCAAVGGSLSCLRLLHKHGVPWHPLTSAVAAAFSTRCLKFVHEHGAPWHMTTTKVAVKYGSLSTVRFCHEHGAKWHPKTLKTAARSSFACLKYAHKHGAKWQIGDTSAAARSKDLQSLTYCHQHGAPWDAMTTTHAAEKGALKCLVYAYKNGAPWHTSTAYVASRMGEMECLKYAVEHGAPRDASLLSTCVFMIKHPAKLHTFPFQPNHDSDTDDDYDFEAFEDVITFATASKARRDTLLYVLDAGFKYFVGAKRTRDHGSITRRQRQPIAYNWQRESDYIVIRDAFLHLHKIRIIQRAWRAMVLQKRHKQAVKVIFNAYMTWSCRPGEGLAYKRARASFYSAWCS